MLVHMNSSFLFVYIPILLAHKWLACKLSTIADIHPELQQCTHIYIWHMGKLCLCQRHTVPILTPDRLTHLEFRILREDGPELSQRPVITRIRSKNDVCRRSHNGIRIKCEGNTNMWFFYMMLGSMYWFYCTTLLEKITVLPSSSGCCGWLDISVWWDCEASHKLWRLFCMSFTACSWSWANLGTCVPE